MIFAATENGGKEVTTMFQIELLSGGVFWVYAVYPQNSAFLIWKDDHWVWMAADKCKPYVQPWISVTTMPNDDRMSGKDVLL